MLFTSVYSKLDHLVPMMAVTGSKEINEEESKMGIVVTESCYCYFLYCFGKNVYFWPLSSALPQSVDPVDLSFPCFQSDVTAGPHRRTFKSGPTHAKDIQQLT